MQSTQSSLPSGGEWNARRSEAHGDERRHDAGGAEIASPRVKGEDMIHDAQFERVRARLKAQLGQEIFTSWFGRLKVETMSKSVVRLSVPTTFLKSWIQNRYLDLIGDLFRARAAELERGGRSRLGGLVGSARGALSRVMWRLACLNCIDEGVSASVAG